LEKNIVNMRSVAKKLLPAKILNLLRIGYQVSSSTSYWLPYVFMQGKAWRPRNLTFEITYRCNLRCVMCPLYNELKKGSKSKLSTAIKASNELSTDEIISFLKDAASSGIKTFTITGGEPFIRDDLLAIVREAKSLNLTTTIISNGTLIKKDTINDILESGLDYLSFSLDGPQDVHDSIRNSKGAFNKTVNAIDWITSEKKKAGSLYPLISINCTISAYNMGKLSDILYIAETYRVPITYQYLYYTTKEMEEQTNSLYHIGSAKYEDQDLNELVKKIDCTTLQEEINKIIDYAVAKNLAIKFQPPLKNDEIARRFYDDSYAYVSKCFLPWYALRVNPFGNVYPCSMSIIMGNIKQNKLATIWNGEKYISFRKALKNHKLFPKCTKCCVLCDKLWSYLPG
jgi:MoaA/NifB/PqqE/SkfB family radical SAM enzyme